MLERGDELRGEPAMGDENHSDHGMSSHGLPLCSPTAPTAFAGAGAGLPDDEITMADIDGVPVLRSRPARRSAT